MNPKAGRLERLGKRLRNDLHPAPPDYASKGNKRKIRGEMMKMFIWKGVNTDYTSGMVVVVAETLEQALTELQKAFERKEDSVYESTLGECLCRKPEIRDLPSCVAVFGGG